MSWLDGLPKWARGLVAVAVSTAIATYFLVHWLPSPMLTMLEAHVKETQGQTWILKRICENTAKTPYEAGRCVGEWAVHR